MKSLRWFALPMAVAALAVSVAVVFAAEGAVAGADDPMVQGINLLARFFVLSVVIEVAFSTLFNWKVYLLHLHDKGYKTPILVISLFVFCWSTDLDIVGDLVKTLFPGTAGLNTFIGMFLTALLLAGGSGAMNTLFDKLKIRNSKAVDERARALRSAVDNA
ncbi:hypothetical protein [Salidesulfovibrio onnuriiensis]|uniref:hypothetical protein n=1 Tax=Salidesulfovibrio onnuriiensis TaxID=2583823 RepID=UPI0011C8660D|nr:hypothetical protein [Salidesulfovibrio onnuriiensis]